MALNNVSLNKLLKMLPRPLSARQAIIRRDAADAVLKEKKIEDDDGGDFYGAFWADAKEFVLRGGDFTQLLKRRIRAGPSKRRLYPMLLEGFFRWYESNFSGSAPAQRKEIVKAFGKCSTLTPSGSVRVHGLLAWEEPDGSTNIVYPYFDKDYALSPRTARLGRGAMAKALADHDPVDMTILDVLRGVAYDNDNCALRGDEEGLLADRYVQFLSEWETQKRLLRRS